MTLKVGFGHTAVPADFRTKATLDVERAESEAFAAATGIKTGRGTL